MGNEWIREETSQLWLVQRAGYGFVSYQKKREETSLIHPKVSYKSELGKQSLKLIA